MYRGKQKHDDDSAHMFARARDVGVTKVIVTAGNLSEAKEVCVFETGPSEHVHALLHFSCAHFAGLCKSILTFENVFVARLWSWCRVILARYRCQQFRAHIKKHVRARTSAFARQPHLLA